MMIHTRALLSIVVTIGLGATAYFNAHSQSFTAIDPAFAGRWQGSAEIVVDWTTRPTLFVDLIIDSSGGVAGVIGDARIVDGHMFPNRGALARWFGWRTDYIVTGRLEGAIIEAEGVVRSGVRIPFNVVAERLEGAVHTTGSPTGGKENMILSARGLELRRVSHHLSDLHPHPRIVP